MGVREEEKTERDGKDLCKGGKREWGGEREGN